MQAVDMNDPHFRACNYQFILVIWLLHIFGSVTGFFP